MNTTARIGLLVKIYVWLIILALVSSFYFENLLPDELQAYLTGVADEERSTVEWVVGLASLPILIVHLLSLRGLVVAKPSAKPAFLYSLVALYSAGLFFGPIVDHSITASIGSLGGLVSGMIVALLLFTHSEFSSDTSPFTTANNVDA